MHVWLTILFNIVAWSDHGWVTSDFAILPECKPLPFTCVVDTPHRNRHHDAWTLSICELLRGKMWESATLIFVQIVAHFEPTTIHKELFLPEFNSCTFRHFPSHRFIWISAFRIPVCGLRNAEMRNGKTNGHLAPHMRFADALWTAPHACGCGMIKFQNAEGPEKFRNFRIYLGTNLLRNLQKFGIRVWPETGVNHTFHFSQNPDPTSSFVYQLKPETGK